MNYLVSLHNFVGRQFERIAGIHLQRPEELSAGNWTLTTDNWCYADHRNLQIAARRVHAHRASLRVCALDGLQPALLLV